ncbi:MAG TPA: hypothetical protein VHB47_19975 [Thermoanaerobaculia bacterium]|jgi:tetratricopeptide (TPR) repeat protein|nr:hypothetical protein [Thermoanaerobaculia bacterium]
MHPTPFELQAFGHGRLPAAQSRSVLHHLGVGCAACRMALAPRLIPWMDDDPAAEARATEPARCGRTLAAAYLRAARRAAQAGARLRAVSGSAPPRPLRRALAILHAEGPAAIGRLPRQLLGIPAIEALLRMTATLGPSDPRLRLRLAELASDLAESGRDADSALREIRCRATIELANAYRVNLSLGAAQHQLDRAAADVARGGYDRMVEARMLQIQGQLYCDQSRAAAARTLIAGAKRIYRREARAPELAHALAGDALVQLHVTGDMDLARELCRDALNVASSEAAPLVTASALMNLCIILEKTGRWREALAMLDRHRRVIVTHEHGRNRARLAKLEGELFGHAGEMDSAARAFASCRRELEAIGQPYEAGVWTLAWAALLERRGDRAAAQAVVEDATEKLLQLDPHREVYLALLYLRTTNRFSATRWAVPLAPMITFLDNAAFNPSLRLQSYLA